MIFYQILFHRYFKIEVIVFTELPPDILLVHYFISLLLNMVQHWKLTILHLKSDLTPIHPICYDSGKKKIEQTIFSSCPFDHSRILEHLLVSYLTSALLYLKTFKSWTNMHRRKKKNFRKFVVKLLNYRKSFCNFYVICTSKVWPCLN